MSERVPEGWAKLKLGNIGTFSTSSVDKKAKDDETSVSLLNYMDIYRNSVLSSSFPFQSVTAPAKQVTSSSVRNGDVFFTPSSETPDDIGHSAVFLGDADNLVHSYHTIRFRPAVNNHFDDNYKAYAFKGEQTYEYFRKRATGSTRFTVSLPIFNELEVLTPPLPEQKKIASILTSVDEVIETTQKQIDKLQDLKKATMNELLTKGIGHTEFKDSELGRIPKSWEVVPIGAYFALTSGKSKPTRLLSPKRTKDNSIPVYGGNGVNGYTDSPLLEKPTIVIGRVGEYCGCVAVTPQLSWVTDNALYVKTILKPYNMQFLFNLLTFTDLSKLRSKGGQPLVSQQPIHDHVVAMPPLEEQEEIASVLSAIDVRTTIQEQKLSQTQSLKKSLMQDLLTGKVRVQVN